MVCMTLCQVYLSSEQPFGVLFWIPAPSPWRTVRAAGRVPMLHDVRLPPASKPIIGGADEVAAGLPPASDQPRIPIPATAV